MLVTWGIFCGAVSASYFFGSKSTFALVLWGLTAVSALTVELWDRVLGQSDMFNNPHIDTLDKRDLEGGKNESESSTKEFFRDSR